MQEYINFDTLIVCNNVCYLAHFIKEYFETVFEIHCVYKIQYEPPDDSSWMKKAVVATCLR